MNAFETYADTHTKRLQVIYLTSIKVKIEKIATVTGYRVSTVRKYSYEYAELIDEAKEFFKSQSMLESKVETIIEKGVEQIYLVKFYDYDGNLLFSKIGTTTRKVQQRIKEEIRYYERQGFSIGDVIIEANEDCGDYPAEMVESYLRYKFIKQYPNTWQKNDRFFNVNIPLEIFLKNVKNALDK